MIDEREALVAAIAASPDDDTPRLVFADWLQENGEHARAEFVRLHCDLAVQPGPADDPRRRRAIELLGNHWAEWFRPLFRALGVDEPESSDGRPYTTHLWSGPKTVSTARISRSRPGSSTQSSFLDWVQITRGFATALGIRTEYRTRPCAFSEAFELEPVTALTVALPTDPPNGRDLLEPCLDQIRSLSIHLEGPDHPAVPGGLAAFLDCAAWSGLRHFGLWNNSGGSPAPAAWVSEVVNREWVGNLTSLAISLADGGLSLFLASAVSQNLGSLTLHNSRLSVDAVSSLAMSHCRDRLARLDLSASDLGPRHATSLATVPGWGSLEELDLGHNPLGDEGAGILARSPMLRNLRRLSLRETGLRVDGILAVTNAVDPVRIEFLDLGSNSLDPVFEHSIRTRLGDRVDLRTE